MKMTLEKRIAIEKQIARLFVKLALEAGYAISVYNGEWDTIEGEIMEITDSTNAKDILDKMFATDDERLYLSKNGKPEGWVWFVYGNDGYDVICDYTTNLEHLMPEIEALSDKLQDQYC